MYIYIYIYIRNGFHFSTWIFFGGLRISTLQVEPKEIPLTKGSWEDDDFPHVSGMGYVSISRKVIHSKKSPTGPNEQTPTPEYLITLATYLGVRW